jgi:hypothetical protein
VIPEDKLPKPPVVEQPVEEDEDEVTYTYVCKNNAGYYPNYNLSDATRFTTTDQGSASCSGKTVGGLSTTREFI